MSAIDTRYTAREGRPRRFWFAETLVVIGILAFAYFAAMLQGSGDAAVVPSIVHLLGD